MVNDNYTGNVDLGNIGVDGSIHAVVLRDMAARGVDTRDVYAALETAVELQNPATAQDALDALDRIVSGYIANDSVPSEADVHSIREQLGWRTLTQGESAYFGLLEQMASDTVNGKADGDHVGSHLLDAKAGTRVLAIMVQAAYDGVQELGTRDPLVVGDGQVNAVYDIPIVVDGRDIVEETGVDVGALTAPSGSVTYEGPDLA